MDKPYIITIGLLVAIIMAGCDNQDKFTQGGTIMDSQVITLPTTGSNSYLIKGNRGYALVDTGMKGKQERLEKAITKAGISFEDIFVLIITHAHPDHYGQLTRIRELTGAPVLCQLKAAQYIKQGKSSPIIPRNRIGRIINALSPEWELDALTPDITFDQVYDLSKLGIKGKVISTPGHSAGSLSITLENGEILVGDLFRGKPGKLSLGMFYENEQTLIRSLEHIASFGSPRIYMSHGTVTNTEDLLELLDTLK